MLNQIVAMNQTQLYSHPDWKEKGFLLKRGLTYQQFLSLASTLGKVSPSSINVEELRVQQHDSKILQSWTNIFGTGFFPYHTDFVNHAIPPKILLLRLADNSLSYRNTLLLDSHLLPFTAEEYQQLTKEKWKVPIKNKRALIRIIDKPNFAADKTVFRYDPIMMKPFSRSNKSAKTLYNTIAKVVPYSHAWIAQDVLIIDNWRILHAREDNPTSTNHQRILQRIIL